MKKALFAIVLCFVMGGGFAQEIKYGACANCWDADSLGNHRVIVQFNGEGKFAMAKVDWRRRDTEPQNIRIIVEDAQTKQKVGNVKTGNINREFGEIYFEPGSGKGNYYLYYMPYKNEGRSNYPRGVYLTPESTATQEWLQSLNNEKNIPTATIVEIQSIDSFNSFYPMEVIATAAETKQLLQVNPGKPYLVFPEDRMYPIKMKHDLPQRWVEAGVTNTFSGEASRGEWYAFQLGVYALQNLDELQLGFSDLQSATGKLISAKNISCINTGGVQYDGKPFKKTVPVDAGNIQALWCGVNVPETTAPGVYQGTVVVQSKGKSPQEIAVSLTVRDTLLADGGISEPWKQTRLKWLNSTMAQENTVIAPYTPLVVKGKSISLLGRKVELNADGFPKQVQTFFTPEMTGYSTTPKNILAKPFHFFASDAGGKNEIKWKSGDVHFTSVEPGTVKWAATNMADALQMQVNASLEFDGFIHYEIKLEALEDVSLGDIGMQIPFAKDASTYLMGLGQKGGYRPQSFNWKWEVATKNQDGAWIGDVNAGLQYALRDEKYVRPLNTNFYLQKPLLLPSSWGNDGKGGITITEKGNEVIVNNYSGERSLKKGEVLYYNFTLLITPFHTINTNFQWQTRFYHSYKPIDTVKASGATVVNIHHANEINPWINYPFIENRKMKAYIDEAHNKGLKVKIYNTIRELSNHAYETFPMRSLGHEIYSPGKGGGFSWLQEHVGDDYIAAWFVPSIKDAAIVNSGMSRWHNYYVEGMNWLVNHVGIDGIYLDDVAFDRVTMKRIKRVLTQNQHPGIIDLHSANQFNKNDGFNNSANLYMEHFPYLNRLWFGEYFDYEKNSPDFFLTEVSGIPFGLMGEMLQDGGNAWRGMIYGMTNRMPWSDNADPRAIWKLWDEFGMEDAEMIGYWSPNSPVKTNHEKVLVTVYKKKGAALISVASWADGDVNVDINIDWKKLGVNPANATVTAPDVANFQSAKSLTITGNAIHGLPVPQGKGLMIVVKEKK